MQDIMLILHFLGLAMGLGTSFAFMFIGIAASKMPEEIGVDFQKKAFVLTKMGHIGLSVLVISGLYLATPYWKVLGSMPLLIGKLVLVFALGAMIGIMSSKAKKAIKGDHSQLKSMAPLGKISLLLGLAIVVLAVLQFH